MSLSLEIILFPFLQYQTRCSISLSFLSPIRYSIHSLPYHTVPFPTLPYHTVSFPTLPYHTVPFPTLPLQSVLTPHIFLRFPSLSLLPYLTCLPHPFFTLPNLPVFFFSSQLYKPLFFTLSFHPLSAIPFNYLRSPPYMFAPYPLAPSLMSPSRYSIVSFPQHIFID